MIYSVGAFLLLEALALIMPTMADRIRITFDVPDRIRRALNIEASRKGLSVGEVIESLVTEHCKISLKVADDSIAEGQPTGTNPRGRRPKPAE